MFLRNASSFLGSVSQEHTAGWMEGRVGGEKPERQDATQAGFMHESPMRFHRAPHLVQCSAVTA